MNSEHLVPALDKALSLLEHLGRNPGGFTQAELAATLDISPSTCYRILQTLQRHDFVKKQGGGRFDISGGLLSAALRLADRVRRFEQAQPVLEALAAKTGLACKLSIRQGFEQLTIARAESPRAVAVSGKVGARFPVIEGSVGAALLCDEEPEELAALQAHCPGGIPESCDLALLATRIAEIRRRGCILNSADNRWHVEALSTPVREASGQVLAALTLLGFTGQLADVAALTPELLAAAREVAARI